MKIYDVPLSDLESVAREVGVTFEGTDESNSRGYRVRGRLIPNRSEPVDKRPYNRVSASIAFHEGRRVFAVCWHGHRDFLARVFTRYPDARVTTAVADYRGIVDFDAKYVDTAHRNIGSQMFPVPMWSACECCENYSYGPMLEISDSDYADALALADDELEITESAARRIASEWHSGQSSSLYAFSSSGAMDDGLLAEIESRLNAVTETQNKRELENLRRFVTAETKRRADFLLVGRANYDPERGV